MDCERFAAVESVRLAVEHATREEAARECVTEKLAVTIGEWWKLLEWKVRATFRTGLFGELRLRDGDAHDSKRAREWHAVIAHRNTSVLDANNRARGADSCGACGASGSCCACPMSPPCRSMSPHVAPMSRLRADREGRIGSSWVSMIGVQVQK